MIGGKHRIAGTRAHNSHASQLPQPRSSFCAGEPPGAHVTCRQQSIPLKRTGRVRPGSWKAACPVCWPVRISPAPQRRICSTTPLERLNTKVKRTSAAVGMFPCSVSIPRLIGAAYRCGARETNDAWLLRDQYMPRNPRSGCPAPPGSLQGGRCQTQLLAAPKAGATNYATMTPVMPQTKRGCHRSLLVNSGQRTAGKTKPRKVFCTLRGFLGGKLAERWRFELQVRF